LEITAESQEDLAIPGSRVTFGKLELAQALGDVRSLDAREKPTIRLHINGSVAEGLATISHAVERALVALTPA